MKLEPLQQIRRGEGSCLSLGPDPAFTLVPESAALPVKWCKISYRGHSARGYLAPKLYLDAGNGSDGQEATIELPPSRGQLTSAVRRLPERVAALRLRPMDGPGRFWIEDFHIQQLSTIKVLLEIATRALRQLTEDPSRLGAWAATAWRLWKSGNLMSLKILVARWLELSQTDYQTWILYHDSPTDQDRAAIRSRVRTLARRPRFSIVTAVFNSREEWLRRHFDSVLNQLYPDWELCIADDASTAPHVRAVLEDYERRDARFKVVYRSAHGGGSVASNSALDQASGDYVVPLGAVGELSEHALYMVAEALNANPDLHFIYSDEDKIDQTGRRSLPHFKGAWNAEMSLHQNYFSRLGILKTDLVREVGGFRPGYEDSRDYDLFLRCVACTDPTRIHHLPHILYHSQPTVNAREPDSTARNLTADPELRALADHLRALGSTATAERTRIPGIFRIRYRVPEPPPLVTLIVPTRNRAGLVRQCIESIIRKTIYPSYQILLIDNESDDSAATDYFLELERSGLVRLLRYEGRFNYSAINNFAVVHADGEVLGLLNNDTEIIDGDWLTELVSHAVRSGVGAVGPKLLYPDGTIQHAGIVLGLHGTVGHGQQRMPGDSDGYCGLLSVAREVTALTAACLVVRKSVYEEVGGLDEQNLPITFNDVDFCLKLRARGYKNIWTPYAVLYHYEAATRGPDTSAEKVARFRKEFAHMKAKWGVQLERDPFYSENLSLGDDYSLAFPPRCRVPWSEILAQAKAPLD